MSFIVLKDMSASKRAPIGLGKFLCTCVVEEGAMFVPVATKIMTGGWRWGT